jgi:hypothetical protein
VPRRTPWQGKRIGEPQRGAKSSLKASTFPLLTILSRIPLETDPSTLSASAIPSFRTLGTGFRPVEYLEKVRNGVPRRSAERMPQGSFTWGESCSVPPGATVNM